MNNRYLFVVADRKFAKIITFYDGILEDHLEVSDLSVPQKVKTGNERSFARNDKIARHIEDHLHRHLQLISKKVDGFVGTKPVNAVFVGGHKTFLHLIKKHLNPALNRKVVGEFVAGLKVSQNEIIKRCEKALLQFEQNLA